MNIKAYDLYNVLKEFSEEELKELNVVIEINRSARNQFGSSEYANLIEHYPSHIRILQKQEKKIKKRNTK